jgi:uncharacterized membrane protein
VKKYLVAGLLVWLPLAITVALLSWLLGVMDGLFAWVLHLLLNVLPDSAKAVVAGLISIPGLGVIVVLVALFLTGVFAANVIGDWAVHRWHGLMHRVPIVKSIYSSVKQVSDTLFSSSGQAFREAVLVQYPRHGSWTIAFVTGTPGGEVVGYLPEDCVSVYVPTTPNPTSGFFLMMPRTDVVALRMSVDEALKYVISMGVVAPPMAAAAPVRN